MFDRLLTWGFQPIVCKKDEIVALDCDVLLVDLSIGIDVIERINKRKPVFVMSYLPVNISQDFVLVKKPIRESILRSQLVKYFCKGREKYGLLCVYSKNLYNNL